MSFPSLITDIGNDFDLTTGMFTAPYNGTYVFILNMYKGYHTTTVEVACTILRNGAAWGSAILPSGLDTNSEGCVASVMDLKKGDTVVLGNCINIGRLSDLTTYIGFVLKAD